MKFNTLCWLFLFGNAVYGLGFLFGSGLSGVTKSSLYTSMTTTWEHSPEVWGAIVSLAVLSAVLAYRFNSKTLVGLSSLSGMGSWAWASLVYLQTGFYMVFGSVGVLYSGFWIYFYFKHSSKLSKE